MKNIIFLDIDGVLQPGSYQFRFDHDLEAEKQELITQNPALFTDLDKYDLGAVRYDWHPEAIEHLRKLCEVCEAEIVISSDWRRSKTLEQLQTLFSFYDLESKVVGMTPNSNFSKKRVQEVQQFLFDYPEIEEFVIIDDAYYNDFVAEFPRNFVHSDKGYLRATQFERAKAILQGKEVEALKPSNSFW